MVCERLFFWRVFGLQKGGLRGDFCLRDAQGAVREATLREVITAPLAAELRAQIATHPVVLAPRSSRLSPHSLHTGGKNARCPAWPPDVRPAWSVRALPAFWS